MAKIPVDFSKLLDNHPFHYQIYSMVDGEVAAYHPPCCIQVSYALNLSGAPIETGTYKVPERGRNSRFYPDKRGRLYLIEVCDFGAYLNGKYGPAENYRGTEAQMKAKIAGRKGIIRFGEAHIDLWEGDRFHQEAGPSLPDNWAKGQPPVVIWTRPSVKATGIFFWETGGGGSADPAVDDPRCGWPTPPWLLGWWQVRWRNDVYYYLFEPNGRVKWSGIRPLSDARSMASVGDNGTCVAMGSKISIRWNASGSLEEFDRANNQNMSGIWNKREPLTATKLW
jgi:hypothetical protein